MTVKITLEYSTVDEAITAMALLRGSKTAPDPKPETATPKSDGAKSKKSSTEPDATADKPTAKAEPVAAQQTQQPASPAPDYAPVAAAIAEAAKTHRSELVALLGKFGAKSGKDLKPEQYADFSAKLAELVKPADDLS